MNKASPSTYTSFNYDEHRSYCIDYDNKQVNHNKDTIVNGSFSNKKSKRHNKSNCRLTSCVLL